MRKLFIIIVIIIVALVILTSLGRQISNALSSGSRLDQAADELTRIQDKNRKLKEKLAEAKNPQIIESILRDKLNLQRPGETVVIIPEELLNKVLGVKKQVEEIKIPNWQGWLRLFIH